MARPIILDCDPGHDDAIALLLAHGSPDIDLLAVTTVAGNHTLAKVTANALRIATLVGLSGVPIAAGCDRPLRREPVIAPEIHGESGLDGAELPEPTVELDPRHGVDVILDTVFAAAPGEVTLVPTGPLTNIATALRREPALAGHVRDVVLMGGAYTRGNRTPAAEFNIFADPEAAAEVFAAPWELTMLSLDLTHQARADEAVVQRFRELDTAVGDAVVGWLEFYGGTYRDHQAFDSPPVHDPCAVAAVIAPQLFTLVPAFVVVETEGRWTTGMTVTDFGSAYGRPHNTHVAIDLDVRGFWDLVVDAVKNC